MLGHSCRQRSGISIRRSPSSKPHILNVVCGQYKSIYPLGLPTYDMQMPTYQKDKAPLLATPYWRLVRFEVI